MEKASPRKKSKLVAQADSSELSEESSGAPRMSRKKASYASMKNKQSSPRKATSKARSNSPQKRRKSKELSDSSEESEDDEEDGDNDGFIASDGSIEEEFAAAKKIQRRERLLEKQQNRGQDSLSDVGVRRGRKQKRHDLDSSDSDPYSLDSDDKRLIAENAGDLIEPPQRKERRLKRNAEFNSESEEPQSKNRSSTGRPQKIDTEARQVITADDREKEALRQQELEKIKVKAQKIFGTDKYEAINQADDKDEDYDMPEADEIDDYFTTDNDKKIAATDIPERLQIKLQGRLQPEEEELHQEAEWIRCELKRTLDKSKSENFSGTQGFELSDPMIQWLRQKIFNVLVHFRIKYEDIPYIVTYEKHEFRGLPPGYSQFDADYQLDEDSVYKIFNLDQEWAKFRNMKQSFQRILQNMVTFDQNIARHIQALESTQKISELKDYSHLIGFLQSFYHEHEQTQSTREIKKAPTKKDPVRDARLQNLHDFASSCFLSWNQYLDNIREGLSVFYRNVDHLMKAQEKARGYDQQDIHQTLNEQEPYIMQHQPNEPSLPPGQVGLEYVCDQYPDCLKVLEGTRDFAVSEIASQPFIRQILKDEIWKHGYLSTRPTEQGKKDLDVFHPSYKVKNLKNIRLADPQIIELYLDIAQCEQDGLIKVQLGRNPIHQQLFEDMLRDLYVPADRDPKKWNIMRNEVVTELTTALWQWQGNNPREESNDIEREIRQELKEEAERYVIQKCKQKYQEFLDLGPYTSSEFDHHRNTLREQEVNTVPLSATSKKNKSSTAQYADDIIKERERLTVLGAVLQQLDQHTYRTSVVVVNKNGELVGQKDFNHLLRPMGKKQDEKEKEKEVQLNEAGIKRQQFKTDEEKMHTNDLMAFEQLLNNKENPVELIVISANSLRAKDLKDSIKDIAKNSKKIKVTIPIYGRSDIPKLFAMSHNSEQLHPNMSTIRKQAIALARHEQDPMSEILNLWSPIIAENMALSLNLDPLQKLVNQVKLNEALEEANIKTVNGIGVDLNKIYHLEHMQQQLQFVSGLGPRKSKQLLKTMKKVLISRIELYAGKHLARHVFISALGFLKIKASKDKVAEYQILDQTRIHLNDYNLVRTICHDICSGEITKQQTLDFKNKDTQKKLLMQTIEVIKNPQLLEKVNWQAYNQQKVEQKQYDHTLLLELIKKELMQPFSDPRKKLRNHTTGDHIKDNDLMLMMIDETPRTFKVGMIVSATVTQVVDQKAFCRLENGLKATIDKAEICDRHDQRISDKLQRGNIVTGRIREFHTRDVDSRFEVKLACKQENLRSHYEYIEKLTGLKPQEVPKEDLENQNFAVDNKPSHQGRFVPRRIAFEKFKNISSRKAALELLQAEPGDYIFRPSTRSESNLTLTWKFWKRPKDLVHIDIQEMDKENGAAIGRKLMISRDSFDNLREIVERYIIPCNRLVREVINHPRFVDDADTWEQLQDVAMKAKKDDQTLIPYRFGILSDYPQHIVLAYVPKTTVFKEFIRVKPRGFNFHSKDDFSTLPQLINWFKDNWKTRDYQRFVKRQRSPRIRSRNELQTSGFNQTPGQQQETKEVGGPAGNNKDWGAGGDSVYSAGAGQRSIHQDQMRPPPKSFGRGQRFEIRDPRENREESGMKSPNAWNQPKSSQWGRDDHNGGNQHQQRPSRQDNYDDMRGQGRGRGGGGYGNRGSGSRMGGGQPRSNFNSRDQSNDYDGRAHKRQRGNDGGSIKREGHDAHDNNDMQSQQNQIYQPTPGASSTVQSQYYQAGSQYPSSTAGNKQGQGWDNV